MNSGLASSASKFPLWTEKSTRRIARRLAKRHAAAVGAASAEGHSDGPGPRMSAAHVRQTAHGRVTRYGSSDARDRSMVTHSLTLRGRRS